MSTLIMVSMCVGVALGLYLIFLGIRGVLVLPTPERMFPTGTSVVSALAWIVGAFFAGLVVLAITGWLGAFVGVVLLVLSFPWFLGGGGRAKADIEKSQAMAAWAEMIRDNMAGAAGLEQALASTADIAPAPIAAEVRVFASRLESRNLVEALILLGRDLNHSSADLIIVSLVNAARMEGRDLGPLLGRLADATRADVRMRLRIEVGRARIKTSSRIVLGVTLLVAILLYAFAQDLLEVYDTLLGQVALLAIFLLFGIALWLMKYFGQVELPERFSARATQVGFGRGYQT